VFTGIIENTANLINIKEKDNNLDFYFKSNLINELKIDQSVSHNGVCLTVVDISDDLYIVTAIKETLNKSNLGDLAIGDSVNIERSMLLNGRLDGHIVQGHVDQTGVCKSIMDQKGSYLMTFQYNLSKNITVEKGSICINGISLTVVNSKDSSFSVAVIPYTWENTNLKDVKVGGRVNLEFDILGKYISKLISKA
jgi:riboflavin synthase|tara:strand:- start:13549 stop:14133 length:585 start_codon:yes stop_codon:yes gene_type:complete